MQRLTLVVVSLVGAAAACGFPADLNRDGDVANGVGFQFPSSLTDETVGTHSVSIALSRPATDLVTVDVEVVETGSADGNDFSLAGGQISFPVGADRAEVELQINDDGNDAEEDETIELRLVNASNATIFHDSHEVTISNTPLPRFTWDQPTSTAGEGDGPQTFSIVFTRALPVEGQIGVGQSGSAGVDDYTLPATTLVIPAGTTELPVEIAITDENIDENEETAALTLSAITGAILEPTSNGVHEHTIVDNDDPPIAAFQVLTDAQAEDGGTKQVVVTLSPQSGKVVTFGFTDNTSTTSGGASAGDYAIGTSSPLTFMPGETQKMIAVTPNTDALYEDDELVALALSGLDPQTATLSGTHGATRLTITNDDAMPSLQFDAGTGTATEGSSPYNVVIELSAVSGKDVTFSPTNSPGTASNSADYSFSIGEVTIPAGTATYTLPVTIANDNIAEGGETFTIGLAGLSGASAGAPATHTATIAANDACSISWDPTENDGAAPEGDGSGTINYPYEILLTNPSATNVTIVVARSGDASNTDASINPTIASGGNTTITFTPGEVTKTVTVEVNRDNDGGGGDNEDTVTLTLMNANGCTLTAPTVRNHVIQDDD